jgi:collagen type I alpha
MPTIRGLDTLAEEDGPMEKQEISPHYQRLFPPASPRDSDLTSLRREDMQDLAWLEQRLIETGLSVETAYGRADDGSAWAVVCDSDDGEALIHVARIDGSWVVATSPLASVLRGQRLRPLLSNILKKLERTVS